MTRDSRLSLAEMRSEASDTGKDTRGGDILVGVKLRNRGNVQLDVTSLRLTASKVLMEAFTNINAKTATAMIDPGPGEDGSGDGSRTPTETA